ncbi:ABC-type multidrug transport system, ATPase component [Idiomarina sp. A28L]|uniref:ABC transporter ATP-binding protein n=1 Tax=Idiomarina sp. A28L TaxID=1036674 RepID=UPI00021386F7|nr:ABC transporter ATP-binding protein [Idiomarina sp. A28L]EGN75258.1 ABC-type multidrug transport system, ATPase component [Idiomarina sp. A28L]
MKKTEATPILSTRGLTKTYDGVNVVDKLDLDIREGICFGLLGPNGAGKTTTIEMLEGILPPNAGEILYRGKPADKHFFQHVGIQFQHTALPDFLKVNDVLNLFSRFYDSPMNRDELIAWCNLEDILDRDHRKLSGGQKQRLLLALALMNDPDLLFLDEPTTGLDPQARRNFWELVRSVRSRGKTVLLTTHYMDEAEQLCDEIAVLDKGKVLTQGAPRTLLNQYFNGALIRLPVTNFSGAAMPAEFKDAEQQGDFMQLQATQVDATLSKLIASGVSLNGLQVESATLDDLFLKLTGHELRGE